MTVRVSSLRLRLLSTVALALMAGSLAGCKTAGLTDVTGSISSNAAPRSDAEWRRESEALGEKFRANPRDADVAIRYAQALRAIGQRSQAAAVLETAAIHNPNDKALLGAYGRALADAGNFKQALDVLERAHSPDQPDWRILSVQGAVMDQMGRHADAQRYYASALKIVPDEPSVLSNLGSLLCALEGSEASRGNLAPRVRQGCRRQARAAEPRAGGWAARPLQGGRDHRACRAAAGRSDGQCRLSAPDAGAEGQRKLTTQI